MERIFAVVQDGSVVYVSESQVNDVIKNASVEELAANGWYIVEPAERPEDTATETHDMDAIVTETGGYLMTWVKRLKTDEEITSEERAQQLEAMPGRIQSLEEENMMLMIAAAESYEVQYNENMNLMLAVAELYELVDSMLQGGM